VWDLRYASIPSYDLLRAIFAIQQAATILGSQHGRPNELRSQGAFALLTAPIMHKITSPIEIPIHLVGDTRRNSSLRLPHTEVFCYIFLNKYHFLCTIRELDALWKYKDYACC